jgi:predicted nucleic acid-binding protein
MNLVDTNVIVRFLLGDKDEKYKGIYELFKRIEEGTESVECPILIFFQVIFVLKSVYRVKKDEIIEAMSLLLKYRNFYIARKSTLERTLHLWKRHNLDIIDCYLIACVEGKRGIKLYSYDRGFDKIESVERIEP